MTPRHIRTAAALITSHEATCQGFLDQARVKTERAAPYVSAALQFWQELQGAGSVEDLAGNERIQDQLISTAGVSAKARGYLQPADIARILSAVMEGIPKDRKDQFREEVFYRYLLTKGASLDGEMRNYTGAAGRACSSRRC